MNDFIPAFPTEKHGDIPQGQTTTLMIDEIPSEVAYSILSENNFNLTPEELKNRIEGNVSSINEIDKSPCIVKYNAFVKYLRDVLDEDIKKYDAMCSNTKNERIYDMTPTPTITPTSENEKIYETPLYTNEDERVYDMMPTPTESPSRKI
jgi:hypothetical protein